MGLETGTFISDLVPTNPVGATDPKSQGDDHLRLIKSTIKNTFPNINGPVNATPAQLNHLVGVTAGIQGQLDAKADAAATSSALALKANDADVVNLAGNQDITGRKVFVRAATAVGVNEYGMELRSPDQTDPSLGLSILFQHADRWWRRLFVNDAGFHFVDASSGNLVPAHASVLNAQTIELGHASDTTLSRIAAGRVAIAGGEIAKLNASVAFSATQTFGATPAAPATTGAQVRHADGNLYDTGLNVMPPLTINAAVTFARTHVGKTLVKDEATARTWSTPDSSDTNIPLGSTINLMNLGTGAITVAAGSGVTLSRINGTGAAATGSRTLAQGGIATLWKRSATSWVIWGNLGLS